MHASGGLGEGGIVGIWAKVIFHGAGLFRAFNILVPTHLVLLVPSLGIAKAPSHVLGVGYHLWLRTTALEAKLASVHLPPLAPGSAKSCRTSLNSCPAMRTGCGWMHRALRTQHLPSLHFSSFNSVLPESFCLSS